MLPASYPILVTRAEPGARETFERLRERQLNACLAPMLSLKLRADELLPSMADVSGLVFTSANGVRVFANQCPDRALPAWCVGPATAMAARDAGFSAIHESAGNAEDLANYIARHATPDSRPLLHVANAAATGSLQRRLKAHGFSVIFTPLYEMQPAAHLSQDVADQLRHAETGIVLIHSAKGAAAFASLARPFRLERWHLVGISTPALAPLGSIAFAERHIARAPNESGLFDALDTAIATLST